MSNLLPGLLSTHRLSRGHFLRGAVGLTGAAIGAGALSPRLAFAEAPNAPLAAQPKGQVTAVSRLIVDDDVVSVLHSVRGGNAYLDLTDQSATKSKSALKYEQLDLEVPLEMHKMIAEIVTAAWRGEHKVLNASIVRSASNGDVVSERHITNATVVGVSFPVLDGKADDCWVTVSLAPESTSELTLSGAPPSLPPTRSKRWAGGFTLDLGLDPHVVAEVALSPVALLDRVAPGIQRAPVRKSDTEMPHRLTVTWPTRTRPPTGSPGLATTS
jgi:hypothetical protein